MGDDAAPWWRGQATDVPHLRAVKQEIDKIIRAKFYGWSLQDQEDLASVVWLKYVERYGKNKDRHTVVEDGLRLKHKRWLRRVAINAGFDSNSNRAARKSIPVDFDESEAAFSERIRSAISTPSPSKEAIRAASGRRLREAVGSLTTTDTELIFFRFIEGDSIDTIAGKIGKSSEATKKAVQRATGRLREKVKADTLLADLMLGKPDC